MHRWHRMAVLAFLIGIPGCFKWKQVPVPEPPAPPNVVANLSRVRLATGQSVDFLTLVVTTDSVFGIRNNLARTRVTISHNQIRRIEVRHKDPVRTLGLLALIANGLYWSGAMGLGPNR
jgi:hypothetical protein